MDNQFLDETNSIARSILNEAYAFSSTGTPSIEFQTLGKVDFNVQVEVFEGKLVLLLGKRPGKLYLLKDSKGIIDMIEAGNKEEAEDMMQDLQKKFTQELKKTADKFDKDVVRITKKG